MPSTKVLLRWIGALLILLFLILLLVIRIRFGGGKPYPDLSTRPLFEATVLDTFFSYPEPLGNLAVSADNRLFFSVHPESRPEGHTVLEVVDGKAVPYPDAAFQETHFQTVLGMVIDEQDRLWTIDHGNHGFGQVRLLAFDLRTDSLVHDYLFGSDIAPLGSFFNDLQVSSNGETVFVADIGFIAKKPALVVYDTESRRARRLLEKHPSMFPQDWIIHTPTRKMTFLGGLVALKPGIDGIVIDIQNEWLYYGAMAHDGLFRIPVSNLKDEAMPRKELAASIERMGDKPLSDGLSIDSLDRIYITDVEHGGIARMDQQGKLQTLIKAPKRVRWADGLSFGGDGLLYFTDSAIPDQMLRSKKHIRKSAPYYIFRFDPGTGGIPGR